MRSRDQKSRIKVASRIYPGSRSEVPILSARDFGKERSSRGTRLGLKGGRSDASRSCPELEIIGKVLEQVLSPGLDKRQSPDQLCQLRPAA